MKVSTITSRFLFFGFNDPLIRELPLVLLSELDASVAYWVTDLHGRQAETALPAGLQVMDVQDVMNQNLDADNGTALAYTGNLSDELLSCYQRILPVFLMMMDRVELHGPGVSYQRRKAIFHTQFFYWLNFLKANEITHFFMSNLAHEMADYVIAELCQVLRIPTLSLMQLGIDATVVISSYRDLGSERMKRVAPLSETGQKQLDAEFSNRVDNAIQNTTEKPPELFYMKKDFWKGVNKDAWLRVGRRMVGKMRVGKLKNVNKGSLRYARYLAYDKPFATKQKDKKLRQDYMNRAVEEPDLKCPFIYLSLHYQPELTTTPMGESFSDQYLIAETLLAAFPAEVKIYVKEHPNQKFLGRGFGYYELYPPSDRIVFIGLNVSTFDLQRNCMAVATVTGTVGFEALWFGRPVLLFGYGYYRDAPGVYFIDSVAAACACVDKILNKEKVDDLRPLLKYMVLLKSRCIPANTSSYRAKHSKYALTPEENTQRIVKEFVIRVTGQI